MAGRIIFKETDRVSSTDTLLPKPQDISLNSTTQTYSSVSQNLSVETRSRGIQRWQISMNWPPLPREEAMRVYSFFVSQQGTFGSFQIRLPDPINATAGSQINNTTAEGLPMVTDNRTNLSRTMSVGNFNRNRDATNPVMKAGDFFKFSNHEKLYMLTSDLTTNNGGQGVLTFTPPLISRVAAGTGPTSGAIFVDGTTIVHTNPEITVSLKADEFDIPVDENVFYAMSVSLGERVTSTNTTTT